MKTLLRLLPLLLFSLLLQPAEAQTTFTYTGSVQTYTVTTGATSLTFDVQGASGGASTAGSGGKGGRVQGNLAVTAGEVLYIFVGGQGHYGTGSALGGYNGGGANFGAGSSISGGSGGGASDIRTSSGSITSSNRLVVAGGGAGAGAGSCVYDPGGAGGGLTGEAGYNCSAHSTAACGSGGSQTGGGIGATSISGYSSSPRAGSLGLGGVPGYGYGGGGGGGYYGGGSGEAGGGGGGSSYTDSTVVTSVVHTQGYDSASDGLIVLSVYCSVGAITGGSAVVCSSAGAIALSDTSSGYWSSSNTVVATVGSATGTLTGITTGTAVITFTKAAGCVSVLPITVNPMPAGITGTTVLCTGDTTTLTDSTLGGTWSSSASGIAAIVSTTGKLSGISAGVATITYTATLGCGSVYVTRTVTVNPIPNPIGGSNNVCVGSVLTLSESSTGGVWSSTIPAIATTGTTGLITGVSPGIDTIKYSFGTGCAVIKPITVNIAPAAIAGVSSLCIGSSAVFTDATTVGTWTSSNTAVATAGSSSGTVNAVATGGAVITYTLTDGCQVTTALTVYPVPSMITGAPSLCVGAAVTLSDSASGGLWSATGSIASVGSATGVVTGLNEGTAVITYMLPSGCMSIKSITVNPLPSSIVGLLSDCIGNSVTLYESGSGVWTSGSTGIATIGSSSGVVAGINVGTDTITYILPTGCSTTAVVTINPNPAPITGPVSTCYLLSATLTDTTSSGTWYSSAPGIASIDGTGTVTGYGIGTVAISYIAFDGCIASILFTVNPSPGAIAGVTNLCIGNSATLTDSISGGIWSSASGTIAPVGSATGTVSGMSLGTTTITYALSSGCSATHSITVLSPVAAIGGPASVCVGFTATETETTTGGTWSMSPTAIGTISSGGVVRGITTGTATVSYTSSGGCLATKTITVNTTPLPISGSLGVCRGSTTTLTDGTGGGTWSSGSLTIGTIGSVSGIVSGISTGTTIITYSLGLGCSTTAVVTVNSLPTAIGGPAAVCVGSTIDLTDAGGGTWISSNSNATVVSGTVAGATAGSDVISYILPTGCLATKAITINALPGIIGGPSSVCSASSITLTDGGTGTWTVTGPATIAGSTGVLTAGSSSGIATVTYTLSGTGCAKTAMVTVNPLPTAIIGTGSICPGYTLILAGPTGGVWSGSSIATIGSTGIVTGMTGGIAIISYVLPTGCYVTTAVTVNPAPAAIGGPSAVCVGSNISLTESSSGTWASSSTPIAIGTSTGIVTGLSTGVAIVTFTTTSGCSTTTTVTVSLSPTAITGAGAVCSGATTTLTDTVGGGLWSASAGTVSVGSLSGVVTGISAGTAVVTYSLGTGCTVWRSLTVAATPSAITGSRSICIGTIAALADSTAGGAWSIAPATVGTISTSGMVLGLAAGTAYVNYSTGICSVNDTLIVNPTPTTIGGPATVCQGATITATDAVTGGTWSTTSSNITIGSSGSITGINAGTAVITYSIGSCAVNKTITVNPITAITGASGLCVGNTTILSDATTGGRWSEAGTAISIGSGTGLVTGLTAGTANITYTTTSGCTANYSVTVNTTPSVIGGTLHVCMGSTTNLSNTAGGGTWTTTSSNITIGSASGIVDGLSAGTAPVMYSLGTGCTVSAVVTVNLPPSPITGPMNVCPGATTTLSESGSGSWSAVLGAASVGSTTGVVTGLSAGTATISFTSAAGCIVTATITVNPLPDGISGVTSLCEGLTTTLTDASIGGTWSTSSLPITIGSTGLVTAISAGTGFVTYTLPTGCATTASIYVNPAPPAITGATAMCISSGITLSDALPGGGWSTTSGSAVSVGSASGIVTGVSLGAAIVSYTLGGCSAVTTVSVTSLPPNISGTAHLCVGITDTLTDAGGGIWTSSNPLIATIGSATGAVVGVIPGTLTISYSLGLGCTVSMPVTVNATPASITGPSVLCAGSAVTLHDATIGGTWSSSNTALAMVGSATSSSCVVSGVSGGTANISYISTATGCASVYPLEVIQVPAITGAHNVCAWGDTMTVHDPLAGGSFTSTLVTVSDSGAVLSYAPGTAVITYTESHGCFVTATITVNPLPGEITGSRDICVGATAALMDTSIGGTWSIAPTAAGSISMTGVVTGLASGEVAVTYTTSRYGCSQSMTITVDAAPMSAGTITGSINVCAGSSITLSNTTIGGIWSATTSGIATIGSATGVVIAITAGTATINYTVSNHCGSVAANKTVTVNADVTPTISISTTTDTLCAGSTASFTAAISNGGSIPVYVWKVNGVIAATTGSSYIYTPINGDAVTATLTSNAQCAVPASVTSNTVTMTIDPQIIPTVTINAIPGGPVLLGSTVSFTASVTNGGAPTYQWMLDGVAIPGATNSTYAANNFNNGDSVSCLVKSGGMCGGNSAFSNAVGMVVSNVGVQIPVPKGEVLIYPNPSNGTITIEHAKGAEVVIYDVYGSARLTMTMSNDKQQVDISELANGVYMLRVGLSPALSKGEGGVTYITRKLVKAQ